MKIILYSNDCPRCKVLEMKLNQKGVDFEINHNLDDLLKAAETLGVSEAPILGVDNQLLNFVSANQFLNDLKN